MGEARIVWANDKDGVARHIMEVESGLGCKCTCPGCNVRLEAVNSRNINWKRRPHFRHHEAQELDDCVENALLVAARKMVRETKVIELPGYEVTRQVSSADGKVFSGKASEAEKVVAVEAVEFIDATDAFLTLAGGQRLLIRLVATTKRVVEPKQSIIGEIVIDVADPVLRTADPDTMRQYISLGKSARRWCHHVNEAALTRAAQDDANSLRDIHVNRLVQMKNTVRVEERPSERTNTHALSTTEYLQNQPQSRKLKGGTSYCWSSGIPLSIAKISRRYQGLWPRWDWKAVMEYGEACRNRGDELETAILLACQKFGFSEKNPVVRDAWLASGVLRSVSAAIPEEEGE